MGIDVYTTSLSSHFRNLDAAAGAALRAERHPLTSEGFKASRSGFTPAGRNLGILGAFLAAREASRTWATGVKSAGSPWAGPGPVFALEVDRMDPRMWLRLVFVLSECRSGWTRSEAFAALDQYEGRKRNFFGKEWDDFAGIAFARAADTANSMIVPATEPIAFAAGGVAVASTVVGRQFLEGAISVLGFPPAVLEDDHDPDMSEEDNGILYNLRLFHFYIEQANRDARVIGIWG